MAPESILSILKKNKQKIVENEENIKYDFLFSVSSGLSLKLSEINPIRNKRLNELDPRNAELIKKID